MQTIFKLYPLGNAAQRYVRSARPLRHAANAMDRAHLENALVEQGSASRPLGTLSRPRIALPPFLDEPRDLHSYVRKPFFGREGANVTVSLGGITMESTAGTAAEAFVY